MKKLLKPMLNFFIRNLNYIFIETRYRRNRLNNKEDINNKIYDKNKDESVSKKI